MTNPHRAQTPVKLSEICPHNSFTLIEVIVGIALMLIVFLGIFAAYQLGLKVVGQSKNKIIATAIANEWLEKIRNLPYSEVGIKGASLPYATGILDLATTTIQNNVEYSTEIQVKYVVDPADGMGANDSCNWDYKRAEVKVSWGGRFAGEVRLVTDVAPKNKIEEINTCLAQPGGILSVSVFDAYGEMVNSPLIEIFDPETGQLIASYSPTTGKYDFPLVSSTYKVRVSKSGYSSEETFASGDTYQGKIIVAPAKPNPIVLEGQITEISFLIDRLSSMTVETRGERGVGYPVIHKVTFNLRGEKIIGTDANENPVYKYSQNQTTNGAGSITIPNLEWDSYYFSIVSPDLDLVEIESPPGTTTTQPIGLKPNTSLQVRLILKSENSLLITVQNKETLEPIFSATTTLSNLALGYGKTQYTDEKGQTYFIPLESANYNLEVEAPGYLATSTTVSVSGSVIETIKLEQIE